MKVALANFAVENPCTHKIAPSKNVVTVLAINKIHSLI